MIIFRLFDFKITLQLNGAVIAKFLVIESIALGLNSHLFRKICFDYITTSVNVYFFIKALPLYINV